MTEPVDYSAEAIERTLLNYDKLLANHDWPGSRAHIEALRNMCRHALALVAKENRRAQDTERERDEARAEAEQQRQFARDGEDDKAACANLMIARAAAEDERDSALSRLAALTEAAGPFVKEAAKWPDYIRNTDEIFIAHPDDVEPLLEECAAAGHGRISYSKEVTVGDLRALARLLQDGGET